MTSIIWMPKINPVSRLDFLKLVGTAGTAFIRISRYRWGRARRVILGRQCLSARDHGDWHLGEGFSHLGRHVKGRHAVAIARRKMWAEIRPRHCRGGGGGIGQYRRRLPQMLYSSAHSCRAGEWWPGVAARAARSKTVDRRRTVRACLFAQKTINRG